MTQKITFILAVLLVIFSCTNEKNEAVDMGNLSLSTATPKAGKSLSLVYSGEEELENPYYYELVGERAYPYDLEFNANKEAKINVSDSASAIVLALQTGADRFDSNDGKGYFLPIDDKADLALSAFRLGNSSSLGVDFDKATEFEHVKADYLSDNSKMDWKGGLYWWAREQGDKAFINEYVDRNSKLNTEESAVNLYYTYRSMREEAKADSVMTIIKDKYPNNTILAYELNDEYRKEKDPNRKAEIMNEYVEKYPDDKSIYSSAANYALSENNYDDYYKYVNQLDLLTKGGNLNSAAWKFVEKGENLDLAEKMSKESLEITDDLISNPAKRPTAYKGYYTDKQFSKAQEYSKRMYADTYALIQYKKGNLNEAIKYQKMTVGDGTNEEFNERYINYLAEAGSDSEIAAVVPGFIEKGKASPAVLAAFKTAYGKANPDGNADDVVAKSKAVAREHLKQEIEKGMINKPAPNFTLKDMNGNMVSLADYRGKTVVVDFWATWCGPCKASFPGMQEVVAANKNNDKVAFLFIDTFERGDTREQTVSKFIKDKNYTFDVLYDKENESGGFEAAAAYDVTGIPTKFFIDPAGNIRFQGVGFDGTEKTKQEAEILLDILGS